MSGNSDVRLLEKGKRLDGRDLLQTRDIKMEVGVISKADGSAKVSFGDTTAIASVYGPRALFPRFMQEAETGILRVRYNMSPFSVDDRKSPGHDRRSTEISKVTRLAFDPVLSLEDFPKATVDVFVEIIQADGSTRVTGINAASLALASAGVPMKDLIAACSVGKIDGELIVDLNGLEDNNSESDVAVAVSPHKNEITLLQMDGLLTKEELFELLNAAIEACKKIHEMQKKVLHDAYRSEKGLEG